MSGVACVCSSLSNANKGSLEKRSLTLLLCVDLRCRSSAASLYENSDVMFTRTILVILHFYTNLHFEYEFLLALNV